MINIKDCPLMFYTSNRSLIKKEEIHEPQNNKNMDFCVYIYIYIYSSSSLTSLSLCWFFANLFKQFSEISEGISINWWHAIIFLYNYCMSGYSCPYTGGCIMQYVLKVKCQRSYLAIKDYSSVYAILGAPHWDTRILLWE